MPLAGVANTDAGFPDLRLEVDEDVATLPEILRGHGYATFAVGKWHLTRDALLHDGAPKSTWSVQRGFDRYYGSMEGLNSFFFPNRLVRDNSPVDLSSLPPDYYLTDDYTDQAVGMIKELRANDSQQPFFLYFAHTAMHGPLGAKREDIERFRGRYDLGWDEIRRIRHARQIELGIIGPSVPLPPRNAKPGFDVLAWDSLSASDRELYARYMEVYAAMVHNVDESIGRIVEASMRSESWTTRSSSSPLTTAGRVRAVRRGRGATSVASCISRACRRTGRLTLRSNRS